MSISDKLTYLNGTKTKIREGLNSLGADLDTEDTFRSYADAIEGIYEDYPKITGEGTDLSLDNTKQAVMKLDLKGNTSQASTPTPSSPIPVNVVSGDNTIDICGKNLVNDTRVGKAWNNNSNADRAVVYATIQPNTQYTISFKEKDSSTVLYYFEKTSKEATTATKGTTGFNQTTTITTQATSGVLGIQINKTSITLEDIEAIGIQIEKGSTATTYEPYIGHSYPISLGSIELCKIGNYVDFIFKAINGNSYYDSLTQAQKDELTYGSWYLHKEIGKYNFSENTNTWSKAGADVDRYYLKFTDIVDFNVNEYGNVLCNYFAWASSAETIGTYVTNSQGYIGFAIFSKSSSSTSDWQTWLSNNNLIVYFVLANSTNTLIEDTTLIEQLEALSS